MSLVYKVYIISDDGNGMVQSLQDWDGTDTLELHLSAFAKDAVISIEPKYEQEPDES
jgi:hypothetical protein